MSVPISSFLLRFSILDQTLIECTTFDNEHYKYLRLKSVEILRLFRRCFSNFFEKLSESCLKIKITTKTLKVIIRGHLIIIIIAYTLDILNYYDIDMFTRV